MENYMSFRKDGDEMVSYMSFSRELACRSHIPHEAPPPHQAPPLIKLRPSSSALIKPPPSSSSAPIKLIKPRPLIKAPAPPQSPPPHQAPPPHQTSQHMQQHNRVPCVQLKAPPAPRLTDRNSPLY
nr:extensin-1-like [Penaeus vannamei]